MNELPEELVTIPIPLVGLIGQPSLHFYIEKNLSTRSVVDFQCIHPTVSPIHASNNNSANNSSTNSPVLNSNNPTSVTDTSPKLDPVTIVSTSLNDLSIVNNNNPNIVVSNTSATATTSLSTGTNSTTNNASGWRVQLLTLPIIKVNTMDAGGLSNKKEKKLNHAESFVPLGVIKAGWIHKHVATLPSVVSLFIQWPDDKSPKAHDQILAQIDTVKSNIKPRNVKLMIVIVTNNSNVDVYDEKFSLIRRRADIDAKYFLFLNKSEMKVFVKKWEKLALELSDLHYKEECQNAKQQITKSTHPFLAIRYHFKIAYYSEFRMDVNTSLKYYTFAYNSLKDWKPQNDTRGLRFEELRTIASFLNFKICKSYLWSNNLNESILHFEKHIRLFKIYHGPEEKEFGHCQWIAREYQIFAELLEMCPTTNKTLISTSPAFYYQTAAKYTDERRKKFKKVGEKYQSKPEVTRFQDAKPRYNITSGCIYIGQPPPDMSHPLDSPLGNAGGGGGSGGFPNTSGQLSGGHTDDIDDFHRSIALELQLSYTNIIVDLLNRAHEQATNSGSTRVISYVESLIANEYFNAKNYDLALQYYNNNALTYRREKWWTLLTYTLAMCLKCVHNLNSPTSYIGYSMDLLSPDLTNSYKERSQIQQSLLYVLTDPYKLTPNISLTSSLDVNMDHTHPLINCRVQFPQSIAFSHSKTEFFVVIESHFPNPIRFSKLKTKFSDSSYNRILNGDTLSIVDPISPTLKKNEERKDLVFLPNESRIFSFTLTTKEKMELECQTVVLELGTQPSINFRWNISEWAIKSDESEKETTTTSSTNNSNNNKPQHHEIIKPDPYKKFLERSSIRILDHESLIQIKCNHTPPALVNEFYEIELELVNNDKEITKGTVTLELQNQQQIGQIQMPVSGSSILNHQMGGGIGGGNGGSGGGGIMGMSERGIYQSPSFNEPLHTFTLPHIQEKASFKKMFYLHSSQVDENRLVINVSYETRTNEISHSSKIFTFPVQLGFITNFQFFSGNFQLNDMYDGNIVAREPLLLLCDLKINLPFAVKVISTELKINSISQATLNPLSTGDESVNESASIPVGQLLSSSNQHLSPFTLEKESNYSCWFNLIPLITGDSLCLGTLTIEWSRIQKSTTSTQPIVSQLPILLPHMRITTNPFITNVSVPSYGVVGTPLSHIITVYNNTNFLQEFDLLVYPSTGQVSTETPFLFAGDRIGSFSIHPESSHEIRHVLLPLVAGKHPLPHFKITSKRFNKELPKTKNPNDCIFIKPLINQ